MINKADDELISQLASFNSTCMTFAVILRKQNDTFQLFGWKAFVLPTCFMTGWFMLMVWMLLIPDHWNNITLFSPSTIRQMQERGIMGNVVSNDGKCSCSQAWIDLNQPVIFTWEINATEIGRFTTWFLSRIVTVFDYYIILYYIMQLSLQVHLLTKKRQYNFLQQDSNAN